MTYKCFEYSQFPHSLLFQNTDCSFRRSGRTRESTARNLLPPPWRPDCLFLVSWKTKNVWKIQIGNETWTFQSRRPRWVGGRPSATATARTSPTPRVGRCRDTKTFKPPSHAPWPIRALVVPEFLFIGGRSYSGKLGSSAVLYGCHCAENESHNSQKLS